ncbi:hypothetical protein ACNOYE_28060 [Nannocystaceae bacterium ST9]
MSDLAPLHRRLRRALVLATLLPACTSAGDESKTTKQADDAKKVDADGKQADADGKQPEPEPPTTAVKIDHDPPPPEMNFPPCPSGNWCGPKALVEPLRRKDLAVPVEDVEGCPGAIQGNAEIDVAKFADHPGLPLNGAMISTIDPVATKAKRAAGEADTCCYAWMELCPGGRPLLVDGRPVFASLRSGSDWSAKLPATKVQPPAALRSRIADEWLGDALAEHASIASFRRARAELVAIGAPEALISACERAAEDEVEHARLCFGLAERFSGRSLAPGELLQPAPRGGGPIAVALDTFVEGCVGETIAAACARRAATLADDPVVRGVLERIADDEGEHAALAWATIAWLVEREGPAIVAALRERAELLRAEEPSPSTIEPDAIELQAQGRLDQHEIARVRAQAWRELIDPLLAELRPSPTHVAA